MSGSAATRPGQDVARYLVEYVEAVTSGGDDPAAVIDRYHTSDIVWFSDGIALDRARLLAHTKPARKNVTACRVEVADALVSGDRVAARYTLTATMRNEREIVTESYLFGELADDGRLREVHQITRNLSPSG
jgi:hypothetical protein